MYILDITLFPQCIIFNFLLTYDAFYHTGFSNYDGEYFIIISYYGLYCLCLFISTLLFGELIFSFVFFNLI